MKYRKKPVEIEAFKYDGDFRAWDGSSYVPDWAVDAWEDDILRFRQSELYIRTLEGEMHASVGDYIIKGVQGEIYACKPDIFEATYEKAEDEDHE